MIEMIVNPAAGGGRVVITEGTFKTGSIQLRSYVELHLESNAVLLGSERWEDYPEWENPRGSGKSCYYTDLLPLDDYSALMIYTDFKYPNKDGVPVKTVLTRVITVVPEN